MACGNSKPTAEPGLHQQTFDIGAPDPNKTTTSVEYEEDAWNLAPDTWAFPSTVRILHLELPVPEAAEDLRSLVAWRKL